MASNYETHLEANVMVAMRDGVRLATDIYRPAQNGQPVSGQFPVLLERTPYGKTMPSRTEKSHTQREPKSRAEVAEFFVRHGYIMIYQDCRGRYDSEGVFTKYVDDAQDGYDTAVWLTQQPWCNGKIGTLGLSYAAHTQVAMASLNPPGLACMVVDSGGFSNAFQGGIRQGGTFELKQATWAFKNAQESPDVRANPAAIKAAEAIDIKAWFGRMPWRKGDSPLAFAPEYEDYLFEQWTHGNFDDYWRQPGIYAQGYYQDFPDIPILLISSWYDAYSRTATDNYIGLTQTKQRPIRLLMGPWTHGNRSVSHAGDVDFGPTAVLDNNVAPDYWTLRLHWFDQWLRDVDNGVAEEPTVRYFLMGGGSGRQNENGRVEHGGHWQIANDWPLPDTQFTPYYLHSEGTLSPDQPISDEQFLSYQYDPAHPVPSMGGTITSGAPLMVGGAFDQRESPRFFGSRPPYSALSERSDVLVFQTEPLAEAVEVSGPIVVHLWIASDCPDTDFTMKLIDVYPESADYPHGFAMNITDGILRVRYRDSWQQPELMTPGHIYPIQIEPFPTSNLFAKGHRLRLDISSSNFPHFDLNFNTGEPEGLATHRRIATNRVYMDEQRPSHIILPLIPSSGKRL